MTIMWGSAAHRRYILPMGNRRWKCRCGCEGRATHRGMADGVCLISGCELSVRRWVKG